MEVLLLAAAAAASATAAWMADKRRRRQRNRRGECGACGRSWHDTPSGDAYLIHGRLVCEDCATRARRRLPWYFGTLILAATGAAAATVASEGLMAMFLLPLGTTVAMTVGTLHFMKRANRMAQRRIAAGEFPEYEKVERALPEMAASQR